jgi:hypothetical protein
VGALNVAAGLQPGSLPATPHVQPASPNAQQPASAPPSSPPQPEAQPIPATVAHPGIYPDPVGRGEASNSALSPRATTPPQPAEMPASCHSACPDLVGEHSDERPTSGASPESYREEPAFSSAPAPSPTSAQAPQTPAASTTDEPQHIPATQFARSVAPAAQPNNPPRTGPSTPQPAPNRDARALHFDHSFRLLIDGKPF